MILKDSQMNPLRHVVAATDFSAPARHAAQRAALMAQAHGASFTLMHTLEASMLEDLRRWLSGASQATDALQTHARQRLQEGAQELEKAYGIKVRTQLSVGHPVQQIMEFAEQTDADLLVIGTRGAGLFRGAVVGSTAERIANRSFRPVLLVRQAPQLPYQHLLVPVDFSPWSRSALEAAQQIAPQASLVLMHAVELIYEGKLRIAGVAEDVVMHARQVARQEAQQRLRDLADDVGLSLERVHLSTPSGADPWMLIVQQEQDHDCDLVVIGRQGRNAVDELFLGSTTRRFIAEGVADVLICGAPSRFQRRPET